MAILRQQIAEGSLSSTSFWQHHLMIGARIVVEVEAQYEMVRLCCAWQRRERACLADGIQCGFVEIDIPGTGINFLIRDSAVTLYRKLNGNAAVLRFSSGRNHLVPPLSYLLFECFQIRFKVGCDWLTQQRQVSTGISTTISYLQYDEPLLCTEDIGNVTHSHSEHQFVKRCSQVAVMEAANVASSRCGLTLRLDSGNVRKRSVSSNGSAGLLGFLLCLGNLGRVARVWRFNQDFAQPNLVGCRRRTWASWRDCRLSQPWMSK